MTRRLLKAPAPLFCLLLGTALSRPGAAQVPALPDPAQAPPCSAPDARAIVVKAIGRRRLVLLQIHDARYRAWIKFAGRDVDVPPPVDGPILLVGETESRVYWRYPDRYQEEIIARRQSTARGRGQGLVSVAEIANIAPERLELEDLATIARRSRDAGRRSGGRSRGQSERVSILLPIAGHAPDYYDYQLVDTITVAGRAAFRIAVRPRSNASSLFQGTIDVADSSWDVLGMDLETDDPGTAGTLRNLRYQQRFRDVDEGRSLPFEVRLSGEVVPKISARRVPRQILGIKLPEVPRHLAFEQIAVLDSFRLEEGDRAGLGKEYRLVVAEDADDPDNSVWSGPGGVPLTESERAALARADSSGRHPGAFQRAARRLGSAARLVESPGFFHYNRVDGVYLGAAHEWRVNPGSIFATRLGYALGSEAWQYRFGGSVRLFESHRAWVGAEYHDETMSRPTLLSRTYDPTLRALFARTDPLEYYRDRGLSLFAAARPLDFIRVDLRYNDTRQSSLDTVPALLSRLSRRPQRPNPAIAPGRLRSIAGTVTYDSRLLASVRGVEYPLESPNWTRVTVTAEVADPSLIPNDFSFQRYAVDIEQTQRILGLGTTSVAVGGGIATGNLPPQRYFTVDFGRGVFAADRLGFYTLNRTSYSGNRFAMLAIHHDFDRRLFAKSGVPLVKKIPFTLSLNAGAFWIDFIHQVPSPADTLLVTAPRLYREIGFSLGNLTPFLSPLNFAAQFSWQLSSYPTRPFRFGFGLTMR